MKYISINQTGSGHKNCEDAIYISEDETVFCLADGVSCSHFGREGARAVVTKIGRKMRSSEYKSLLLNGSVQEIRAAVCNDVQALLKELCVKYEVTDTKLFASTFIALVKLDKENIVLIHAGDGAIIGQPNTTQHYSATILSYPDNTPDGKVYCVGDSLQLERMRIIHVRASNYKKLILATDGFTDAYIIPSFQSFSVDSLIDVFKVNSSNKLKELVQRDHIFEKNITDDISCIIFSFQDDILEASYDKRHSDNTSPTQPIGGYDIMDIPLPGHEHFKAFESKETNKKPKEKPKNANPFAIILAAFLIIISIFAGVYITNSTRADERSTELSSMSEQISELYEEISTIAAYLSVDTNANDNCASSNENANTTNDESSTVSNDEASETSTTKYTY